MNWMNLPKEYAGPKSAVRILPVAYEHNVTFGKGASRGPAAIIRASKHIEYYDEQYDCEPFEKGIYLAPSIRVDKTEQMIRNVKSAIKGFTIMLGGDHAVTIGALQAHNGEFGIVHFDAHSDYREQWNGSQYNHACVARHFNKPTVQIGIRSQDADEAKELKQNKLFKTHYAWDHNEDNIKQDIEDLPESVYITIDVDVFDPSLIRQTGTPEPGGLLWYDVLRLLEHTFKQKKVIGIDIVEFAPERDESEAYTLARLVYKIVCLRHKFLK